MQGTSQAFQDAVRGSHTSVAKVEILQNDLVVLTLDIHEGSVTADRTAAQMRRFSATVADPDGVLAPADISSVLAPFGTRARVYRGVRIPSITTVTDLDNSVVTWAEGENNGTTTDPDTGDLILGFS